MESVVQEALINQYNYERFSADVYLSLAVHLETMNLRGMAAYMRKREGEERSHAAKFADYLADRNVVASLAALDKPAGLGADIFSAGMTAFTAALAHEKTVTARIEALYYLAGDVEDGLTQEFLHWFLKEQVEEEATLDEIITKFMLAGSNGAALLMLNEELGG